MQQNHLGELFEEATQWLLAEETDWPVEHLMTAVRRDHQADRSGAARGQNCCRAPSDAPHWSLWHCLGGWSVVRAGGVLRCWYPSATLALRLAAFGLLNVGGALGLVALAMRGRPWTTVRAKGDVSGTTEEP